MNLVSYNGSYFSVIMCVIICRAENLKKMAAPSSASNVSEDITSSLSSTSNIGSTKQSVPSLEQLASSSKYSTSPSQSSSHNAQQSPSHSQHSSNSSKHSVISLDKKNVARKPAQETTTNVSDIEIQEQSIEEEISRTAGMEESIPEEVSYKSAGVERIAEVSHSGAAGDTIQDEASRMGIHEKSSPKEDFLKASFTTTVSESLPSRYESPSEKQGDTLYIA